MKILIALCLFRALLSSRAPAIGPKKKVLRPTLASKLCVLVVSKPFVPSAFPASVNFCHSASLAEFQTGVLVSSSISGANSASSGPALFFAGTEQTAFCIEPKRDCVRMLAPLNCVCLATLRYRFRLVPDQSLFVHPPPSQLLFVGFGQFQRMLSEKLRDLTTKLETPSCKLTSTKLFQSANRNFTKTWQRLALTTKAKLCTRTSFLTVLSQRAVADFTL